MVFMLVMTLWSLVLQIAPWLGAVASGASASPDASISGVCGAVLLILSVWLLVEAVRVLSRRTAAGTA
jgi:hypothetical protein